MSKVDPFHYLKLPGDAPGGSSASSGEKPGRRDAMRRVQKRIQDDGVPREQAAEMARDAMVRVDRKRR